MLTSLLYAFTAIAVALTLVWAAGVTGLILGLFVGLLITMHVDPKGLRR